MQSPLHGCLIIICTSKANIKLLGCSFLLLFFSFISSEFYPETLKGENGKRLRPIVAGIAEQIGTTQLYSAPREPLKLIDSYAE